jgi:hypothetical protein
LQGLLGQCEFGISLTISKPFSSKIIRSIDGQFGSIQEDGTFSGVIGMLARGEIEFGVTNFNLLASRAKVADFLLPFGKQS